MLGYLKSKYRSFRLSIGYIISCILLLNILAFALNFFDSSYGAAVVLINVLMAVELFLNDKIHGFYKFIFSSTLINTVGLFIVFLQIDQIKDLYLLVPFVCIVGCFISSLKNRLVVTSQIEKSIKDKAITGSTFESIRMIVYATAGLLVYNFIMFYFDLYVRDTCSDNNGTCRAAFFYVGSEGGFFAKPYFSVILNSMVISFIIYAAAIFLIKFKELKNEGN